MLKKETTAIVIVNYHSQDLVCECLASLQDAVPSSYLPIVVDNSETPCSDQIQQRHPAAVIIDSGHNRGFAGGCNLGIAYALARHYRYILLLNPDTRAEMDFLAPMLKVFREKQKYGLLGPKIFFDQPGEKVWNAGGKLNWWLGGQRTLLPDTADGSPVQPASYLTGCAMLLRAKAIRDAGMLDERYFLYFEDIDYVQRILRAGWKVGYVHAAKLYHKVSATTEMHSVPYVYYFSRNRIWFMKTWARWFHLAAFMIYNSIVKLPGALLVFGLRRGRFDAATAFWRGYWDGITGSRPADKND